MRPMQVTSFARTWGQQLCVLWRRLRGYFEPGGPPGNLSIKDSSNPFNFIRRCGSGLKKPKKPQSDSARTIRLRHTMWDSAGQRGTIREARLP